MLVRLMMASWEFLQFYEVCKEWLVENEEKNGNYDDDGKFSDDNYQSDYKDFK